LLYGRPGLGIPEEALYQAEAMRRSRMAFDEYNI
jgi:hypothetical protein